MTYTTNTFPTSIQSPTAPTASDQVATFDHAGLETFQNASIEALKTKVGADSSAVTTSHDYKLGEVTGSDKAVGKTASQTLTNKTLTTPTIGSFANANHNHQNSAGGGTLDTSAIASGTIGTARLGSGSASASTYLRGDQTWATISTISIPTIIMVNALFSANNTSFYSDLETTYLAGSGTNIYIEQTGYYLQTRVHTTDWADATGCNSLCQVGAYVYALLNDVSNNYRLYRYDKTNLSAGGTLMTIATQAFGTTAGGSLRMTSNGTDFFFNHKAGNSANDYVVSRYTLSGTTITYVGSDITCGSTANTVNVFATDSSNNIYGFNTAVDSCVRKFNSSGTLQYTTAAYTATLVMSKAGSSYFLGNSTGFQKQFLIKLS